VAGNSNWGLWFNRKNGNHVLSTGFNNADFARDVDARRSTTGIIFFLVNSLVTWQSTKQRVVTQSSCESDYIAAMNVMYQTL
jgi:hypothetical protein